jgi:hypothetical protein
LRPFAGPASPSSFRASSSQLAAASGVALAPGTKSGASIPLLVLVAAACLALGIVLAVVVMRVLGR